MDRPRTQRRIYGGYEVPPFRPRYVWAPRRKRRVPWYAVTSLLLVASIAAGLGSLGLWWSDLETHGDMSRTEQEVIENAALRAAIAVVDADFDRRASADPEADRDRARRAQIAYERALREARKLEVLGRTTRPLSSGTSRDGFIEELGEKLAVALDAKKSRRDAERELAKRQAESEKSSVDLGRRLADAERAVQTTKMASDEAEKALQSLRPEVDVSEEPTLRSSLRSFLLRAAYLGSPGLLVIGALLLLGSVLLFLLPLARSLFEKILETVGQGASAAAGGGSSLGSTAAKLASGTAAAAVAVGAFAIAIPGDTLRLTLQRPDLAEVGVRVGQFGITIPGADYELPLGDHPPPPVELGVGALSFTTKPKTIELEVADPTPEAKVSVGTIGVRVEGKAISIPAERVSVSDSGAELQPSPFVLTPPEIRVVLDAEGLPDLGGEIEALNGKIDALEVDLDAVHAVGKGLVEEARAGIDGENRKALNALFRPSRVAQSCDRSCALATLFGDEAGSARCAEPARLEPLLFWRAKAWRTCAPPARRADADRSSAGAVTVSSE